MLIRGRRGLSRLQILLAGVIGTVSGVYIWKPIFERQVQREQNQQPDQSFELESSASANAETNSIEVIQVYSCHQFTMDFLICLSIKLIIGKGVVYNCVHYFRNVWNRMK